MIRKYFFNAFYIEIEALLKVSFFVGFENCGFENCGKVFVIFCWSETSPLGYI